MKDISKRRKLMFLSVFVLKQPYSLLIYFPFIMTFAFSVTEPSVKFDVSLVLVTWGILMSIFMMFFFALLARQRMKKNGKYQQWLKGKNTERNQIT